jgi:predicted nucleic acid-binding protein
MTINYRVQADVIDIRTDTPQAVDEFLVDTNVWYWMTYTRASQGASPPHTTQLTDYPNYINQALSNNSRLRFCGLALAELVHLIEKTEREIYAGQISAKEFRHNLPSQRANVVSEVQSAWTQVTALATSIETNVNDSMVSAAVQRFHVEPLDGYDLFLLEAAKAAGISKVITDDGDFSGVPGIQMFTKNQRVLTAAQTQGKLVVR